MIKNPGQPPGSPTAQQSSDAILTALAQANHLLFRPGRMHEQLHEVLALLGKAVASDRVYLYENATTPREKKIAHQRASWSAPGTTTPAEQMRLRAFDYALFADADVKRLQEGMPVYGRTPEFTEKTKTILTAQGVRAMAVVPIFSGGSWWGLLGIDDRSRDRVWTKAEMDALKNVAASLGAAVENERLYAAEKSARERAEMLHHVASIISASLDREEVLQRSLDQLSRVLRFDSASIFLMPRENQPPTLVESGHANPSLTIATGLQSLTETPIFRKMMADHTPVLSKDVRKLNRWVWMKGAEHVRSFMAAPLIIQGEMIGVLMVDSHHANFYDHADLQIVSALAQTAAIAVQNASLHTESQQQAKELGVLHQLALAATTAVTLDDLLAQTTEIITQTLYPDHFGFLLRNKGDDFLLPHPSYIPKPKDPPLPAPLVGSIVGRVAQTGEPVIVTDVAQDKDYFEIRAETRSEIVVPVRLGDDVIGVINVESPLANAFNQGDLRFLITLSQLIGSFMERMQLYQTLRQQADSLAEEVRQQTAEIQLEKDRLQTILDSAGEGIILTDLEGVVQYANRALTRVTGFSQQEILGHKSNLWRSNKTSDEIYRDMWQTILRGDIWHGELVNKTRQGMHYDASLTVAPIYNDQGEMTGFVGIQSDISRLKNVERLKSRFITDVSHELRTPVTNLKLYTDLLLQTPPDKHGRYFEVLKVQVARLEQIIEDILTLSRLEVNRLNLESQPLDLNLITEQSIKSIQSKAEAAGLTFELITDRAVNAICGEPALMRQLITNLVTNAINFTPKGKITVRTKARPGSEFVELIVQDTGVGINPEERPFIFDRFFRGKIASHSNISGSGLGLTIVHEIVDLLDGKIELESTLEKGTKVTVMLKTAAASRLCS